MSDLFKEIFDALSQRIRSPFLGSIIFAFVAINWQALFFLLFSEETIAVRIAFFDTKMNDPLSYCESGWSWCTRYTVPVAAGVIIAMFLPFAKWAGAVVARYPDRWLHQLQNVEALSREAELKKQKILVDGDLAVIRSDTQKRVNQAEEQRKFEEAKRDEKVKEELQPETAERLQQQIDSLRERGASISTIEGKVGELATQLNVSREEQIAQSLDPLSKVIIVAIGRETHGDLVLESLYVSDSFKALLAEASYNHRTIRLEQEYKHAIGKLQESKIVEAERKATQKFHTVKLSILGYSIFDIIQKEFE